MIMCKNCCEPVHFLPHICPQYDTPVLLQMNRSKLAIITKAMTEYGTKHYDEMKECAEEFNEFNELCGWLLRQLHC